MFLVLESHLRVAYWCSGPLFVFGVSTGTVHRNHLGTNMKLLESASMVLGAILCVNIVVRVMKAFQLRKFQSSMLFSSTQANVFAIIEEYCVKSNDLGELVPIVPQVHSLFSSSFVTTSAFTRFPSPLSCNLRKWESSVPWSCLKFGFFLSKKFGQRDFLLSCS